MDKLHAMNTFVHIVGKGSLTAAADALGTSLPSVVRTLAALERDVGVRLINRTTRRMHLTDEGTQYLERCRTVLHEVQELDGMFSSRKSTPQGRLAITAPVLFGRRHVVPIIRDFAARYPEVTAEVLLLDRLVNLVEEGMDVGVRIGDLADSSLVAIPVGKVRRVVCASPRYLRSFGTPRTPEDVRKHRCVVFTALADGSSWSFSSGKRKASIPVTAVFTTNQVDAAVEMCVAGTGLGMFLSYQVVSEITAKALRPVLEAFEPEPLPVHVVFPQARLQSPRTRAFLDVCVSALRAARLG